MVILFLIAEVLVLLDKVPVPFNTNEAVPVTALPAVPFCVSPPQLMLNNPFIVFELVMLNVPEQFKFTLSVYVNPEPLNVILLNVIPAQLNVVAVVTSNVLPVVTTVPVM